MYLEKDNAKLDAAKLYDEYRKAWDGIGYEKNAGNNRGIYGDFFEDIVMKFIKGKIKKKTKLRICKGLIKKSNKLSPQIDIIVYSGKARYKGAVMPVGVVDSKDVKMILEVKAYLDKTKINNIREQMKILKKFCPSAKKCIFTAQLFGVTDDQDRIRKKLGFVNNFVILRKKIYNGEKDTYEYDFGNGLSEFLEALNKI